MTQLALSNEEVVNFGVESAEKLFVHLRTKLSGVNRRVFLLNSTGSVPAEVAFRKLLCSRRFEHQRKFFVMERQILPLINIEELFYLLLVVYKLLQKSAQSSTEPGATHSSAVAGDHYCCCWYAAEVGQEYLSQKIFLVFWYVVNASFVTLDSLTWCIYSLINCQL